MKKQFPIISFEHASFQYEGQSQESLKDVKLIRKSKRYKPYYKIGRISCYYRAKRMWKDHFNQMYQ